MSDSANLTCAIDETLRSRGTPSMERAFSVEDLMGNWLRMGGAGFTRTDSEAAFQEWLKRIPSHNNLADAKFTDMLSFNQLSSAHSFQNLQSLGQPPGTLQAPEGLQVAPPTMPRVPSLDLLRQLVQHQSNANAVQSTPCSAAEVHDDDVSSPKLESMAVASVPPPQLVATVPVAAPIPLPIAQVPKAVAIPTHHLSAQHSHHTSGSDMVLDKAQLSKAQIRRERRMLSNRESARRSRKRKQEHLSSLEEQMAKLQEEKQLVVDRVAKLEKELERRDTENRKLKDEVSFLREQLEKAGGGDFLSKGKSDIVRKGPRSDLSKRLSQNGRHDKVVKRELVGATEPG